MKKGNRWCVLGALGLSILVTASAQGATVYSNDFSGGLGAFTVEQSGVGSQASHSLTAGGSMRVSDSDASFATATLGFEQLPAFNSAQPGQAALTFSFDIRVDSFASSNSASAANPRVTIRNNGNDFVTIGFGRRGGYDGYPLQTRNLFYIGTQASTIVPTDTDPAGTSQAIGLVSPGTDGSTFVSGFDFGTYDTTTGTNNDSNVSAAGDGSFLRFELTYVDGESTILCKVTNLDTHDVTTHSFAVSAASFSNVASDQLVVWSGSSSTADFFIDNLSIAATPEPAAAGVLALAPVAILLRRR